MSHGANPSVAKNAASLVNPIVATAFTPYIYNSALPASAFSAYVSYSVYNTNNSTTSQTAPLLSGHFDNVNCARFRLRAYGRVTGGTTTNWTPTLQFGRSPTFATNTTMGSLTASAFNTASGVWSIDAELIWDATSGVISGTIKGLNGSTAAIIAEALITPVTGQAPVAPASSQTFFFSIGGLFSATNAGNLAYLDGFEVEDI
jgi:hypothetical protein